MAVDLSEFTAAETQKGPPCGVALVLDVLDTDRRAKLVAALDNPAIPGTTIARVVTGWGTRLSDRPVQRHRRGDCRCARD